MKGHLFLLLQRAGHLSRSMGVAGSISNVCTLHIFTIVSIHFFLKCTLRVEDGLFVVEMTSVIFPHCQSESKRVRPSFRIKVSSTPFSAFPPKVIRSFLHNVPFLLGPWSVFVTSQQRILKSWWDCCCLRLWFWKTNKHAVWSIKHIVVSVWAV